MFKKSLFIGVLSLGLVGCSSGDDVSDVGDINEPDVEGAVEEAEHIDDFDVEFKDNEGFEDSDVDLSDELSEFKDDDVDESDEPDDAE